MFDTTSAEQRQALLAAIVASSDDAIISKTLGGIITSWNPGAERLFGYSETEAIGQHISIIIPPERLHEEEYIISQVSAGKRVEHFETIRHTKDGREVVISVTISPVIDLHGQIVGASKIARDISTHRKLVKRLEDSEQRSSAIVEAAPFPIGVYTGREMRISLANRSIIQVWGKGDDIIGKTYQEVLPELEGTGIYQQMEKVYDTGIPFHTRNQRVDLVVAGELKPFYFNYSFTPLRNSEGDIYGVMNTAAEVTDLTLAKLQVERSEQSLKDMIGQAPVAMAILLGRSHSIAVANQMMIEVWGKPEHEVMFKPVFDALPDARGQGLEEVMDHVYMTGETYHANEKPVQLIRHGRTEVIYQNFVYQAYKDAGGTIKGIIVITADVTEQVLTRKKIEKSEAELQQTRIRLEKELQASIQLQQQKDDFIGIASHELKTPLTSLSAFIQVVQAKLRKSEDTFLVQAMDKAMVQVKRMTSMINGFLNVSRLEAGKILIEKQPFDLAKLILEIMDDIRVMTEGHKLVFNGCAELSVIADRDKIGSVLSNLLGNAMKYSPNGKQVLVSCKVLNDEALVSIRDEGIGIRPEDLEHIFDRYYRVKSPHTKHIAGFGIGLYLSAEIIREHGGRIWVESESGTGSAFHFALPLHD